MKIAIVASIFNQTITDKLLQGAQTRLIELGMVSDDIHVTRVPGAIEIPLVAQAYAKAKKFAAIICLGAVIKGETNHYDYVCKQVSNGCQRVMLDFHLPVIFGILTTEDAAQALARVGGQEGHKGRDAADAAMTMIKILAGLTLL